MQANNDNAAGTDDVSTTGQYLAFLLDNGEFAIDINSVREIIQYGHMTAVPLMPDFVRGVINLRGAVVPVIDLQARFGKAPAKVCKKTCIVIFDSHRDGEKVELGLLVDAVSAVIDINENQIEPPPQFGGTVRREFIKGMGRVGEQFIIILEPQKALDVQEMAELCEQAQENAILAQNAF
jgi:purine-binding chemotaxis protein CheW